MDFNHLLFSLEGRISRKPYWIGILVLVTASLVLTMALAPMFGVSFNDLIADIRPSKAVKLDILVNLIVLWPGLAITIKRLHDRNRSALWGIILYVLFAVMAALEFMGFTGTPERPEPAFLAIVLLMLAVGLWLLVDLGFRKGTQGVNEYGPNPLAAIDTQEN